jgi:hypothetical protein
MDLGSHQPPSELELMDVMQAQLTPHGMELPELRRRRGERWARVSEQQSPDWALALTERPLVRQAEAWAI